MGSNNNYNINFSRNNFGQGDDDDGGGGGGGGGSGRPPGSGNSGIARQSSIYSLTFDELQNTLGGMGKDFGSMNMDELLKNIWSAEETHSMAMTTGAGAVVAAATVAASAAVGGDSGGYLQRQGSFTLPRTISQKKVDDVFKDIAKEWNGGKDAGGGSNLPQKQPTLKEITLEEFLAKAGVVRDDTQLIGKPNNALGAGIFGNFPQPGVNSNSNANTTNTGLGISFQQPGRGSVLMSNQYTDSNHQMPLQSANLPLNVNGVRTSQQQATPAKPQNQQQQPLYPKQSVVSYASTMTPPSNAQLGGAGIGGGGMVGLADPGINSNLVQSGLAQGAGRLGMVGLGGGGAIGVPTGSPAGLSSDGTGRSNGDSFSVSPIPYMYNGGFRGRKGTGTVDKVVERRQRRMIKNRESAARSRARKQAYTTELEQEVEKLKEENQELRKKRAKIMEMQKNQVMEMMNTQPCPRKKLRRTQTGPL